MSKIQRVRKGIIAMLGGKCVRCGFSDYRALQIDHVNSDGALERAKFGGSATIRFYLRVADSFTKGENRYQLLCCNCNWIKRSECGETANGHKRRS
jgi:hypothetical protein